MQRLSCFFKTNNSKRIKRRVLASIISILILSCTLAGQTFASSNQQINNIDLLSEYTQHMGFTKNQVLDLSINNSLLKLSINECSFCGAFKDSKKRSDIAHKTLDWFLEKTGQKEGTVEWYNKSQQKILVITGNGVYAEITAGPSCAIKQ